MGEKLRLQSCKADVRVKRREGGELEMKVLRYKSLVDCLSVDEGGNGSESKSKKFTILNWEGYVQKRYVNRWLSITTSDGDKHTFKLKGVIPGGLFFIEHFNESQDQVVGLYRNVDVEVIELPLVVAEAAPPVNKVPVANYDSGKKTITYSKDELGYKRINYLVGMVGRTIGLQFYDRLRPLNWILGDVGADWLDYGADRFYARVASVSVEGDDVMVRLTTDIKKKGKFAKEKVEALNNVRSGEYYVNFYPPLYTDVPAHIQAALLGQGIDAALNAYPSQLVEFNPLSVDIADAIALDNGKIRLRFKAKEARVVYFDAATETMGSVLSDKYIEEMIKAGEDNPKCKMKLHVKMKSGATLFIAMENVEKTSVGLWGWSGEAAFLPDAFSSDNIDSAAFLSSASEEQRIIIINL